MTKTFYKLLTVVFLFATIVGWGQAHYEASHNGHLSAINADIYEDIRLNNIHRVELLKQLNDANELITRIFEDNGMLVLGGE